MERGFDKVVFIYDVLARLVFGASIANAHSVFLGHFKGKKRILVLGGGSGKFMSTLYKACPDAVIVFHEASPKMIEKTSKNIPVDMNVEFDCSSSLGSLEGQCFDGVLSCFFWDLFEGSELENRVNRLTHLLAEDARIILGDFEVSSKHKLRSMLVKVMYAFFAITCGLKTKRLSAYWDLFETKGYQSVASKKYASNMIRVDVLERIRESSSF